MKKIIILFTALAILCGCSVQSDLPGNSLSSADVSDKSSTFDMLADDPIPSSSSEPTEQIGSFYGSFLTMYNRREEYDFPYVALFHSFSELEQYFYSREISYMFGKRFTMTCASFNKDEFFKDNDVLMLVISEPSTYVSHTADGIGIAADGSSVFNITRHIPEDAPLSEMIIFHLVFTVPKGSFNNISPENFTVSIDEKIDRENTGVFDAERYRYIYPEFWAFTHPANAIAETTPVIDSIQSYEELLGFYESYKNTFDLDSDFLKYIGAVYDEEMFEDNVLLLAVLPCDRKLPKPSVSDLFVYNLEIFITIDNLPEQTPADSTKWYLFAVVMNKKNLSGVKLGEFNIG